MTGFPDLDLSKADEEDSAGEEEDEKVESLELHTKVFHGWRCSYKQNDENKINRRHSFLAMQAEANADLKEGLKEGSRHKPLEEIVAAAEASRAKKSARARQRTAAAKAKKAASQADA